MSFEHASSAEIDALLRSARTIAIVGLSADPARPSYEVAETLLEYGYRVIPVNPALRAWKGIPASADLEAAQRTLEPGERIDIVDVFRRPEHVAQIVSDCIRLKLPALWLQLGVVDEAAARRAADAGIRVVMDRCIKVERERIG